MENNEKKKDDVKKLYGEKLLTKEFWIWLIISFFMGLVMIWNNSATTIVSSIIMATMMVLPVRIWLERFIIWAIWYKASRQTKFRNTVNPYATVNNLLKPIERENNPGFYKKLHIMVVVTSIMFALLWMIFQDTSLHVVYTVLHTAECILNGRISYLGIFLYIASVILFYLFFIWVKKWIDNEVVYDDVGNIVLKKLLIRSGIFVTVFYGKILLNAILLCFTGELLKESLIIRTIILLVVFLPFEIWNHWPVKKGSNNNDGGNGGGNGDNNDYDDDNVITVSG